MNQSESTFTLPETHFFEQARKISGALRVTKNQALELLATLSQKWSLPTQSLVEQLQVIDEDAQIDLGELYFQLIEHNRPVDEALAIGIEKTPGNLAALEHLLNRYANFKVILTSRNPLDFASSISEQYWSPDSIIKISQLWNQSMRKMTELEKKFPTRVMLLDYAQMTSNPEQAFKTAYQFTGLKWQSSYLSNINAKVDEFVIPAESAWKSENLNSSKVRKSEKKCSLTVKQRLLLHRECFMTALGMGYLRHYRF